MNLKDTFHLTKRLLLPLARRRRTVRFRAVAISILTMTALLQSCLTSANAAEKESTAPESEKLQEISPRMLEKKFNEISERIKILGNEIEDLQGFQQRVKTVQAESGIPKQFESPEAQSVKEALTALQSLAGDVDLKAPAVQQFMERFRRAGLFLTFQSQERNLDIEKQPRIVAEVAEAAIKREKDEFADFTSQLPNMVKLYSRLRGALDQSGGAKPVIKWDEFRSEVTAAAAEIQKIEEIYKRWIEERHKKMTERLTRLEGALQSAIQGRQEQIKQLEKEQNGIAKKLDQEKQDQHSTDKMLVYAVYAMIAAIVALFLSLHLFKDTLATAIVNERTMIELLSMGFLLLTLIILGTGKQIQETTLGTLLGTVAGYIFGRKEGEKRGAQQERQELVKMVGEKPAIGQQ
jgi:hypothetical protein